VLTIIGYSFGDEYVNQIIEQGMRKNPKLRVVVVSPEAERKYENKPSWKVTHGFALFPLVQGRP